MVGTVDNGRTVHSSYITSESADIMTDIIAGVEIPGTSAVAEATAFLRERTNPLIFHHSRRVFLFGSLHARARELRPDPELLYISAMFHDVGLLIPFQDTQQRFELDGADHAHRFLLDRGFSRSAAEVVWRAIALHTTPGIPGRMDPEVAATNYGVLTDAIGWGLDGLERDRTDEIVAAHPRDDFKRNSCRHSSMASRTARTPPMAPSTRMSWNTSFPVFAVRPWWSAFSMLPGRSDRTVRPTAHPTPRKEHSCKPSPFGIARPGSQD